MKARKLWQGLLFTALFFTGVTAEAGLILTLDDGQGNTATASDDDGDGFVNLTQSVGSWLVNVATGLTNPIIGSDYLDAVDLNSVNVSGGSGTLTITLTRTGLDNLDARWNTHLGGTTDGSIGFSTLLNGVAISGYDTTATAFSWSDRGYVHAPDSYEMSLVATITHTGAGDVSSFDYHLKVPEPSTLALLAGGLLLTGWAGLRRRRVASVAVNQGVARAKRSLAPAP